jgi:ATP-binding protein involved in chromosome partitioning
MSKESQKASDPTVQQVMEALATVQDPELHKDLVTLHMIRDVKVEDGIVSFVLVLTTPACPLRERIAGDARTAVEGIPGVREVNLRVESSVPNGQRPGQVKLSARNTIAVSSGKGGVGKTTVAVNLAVSLARSGSRVGLLDADIYGPNVPMMMGVHSMPAPDSERLVPPEAFGVKVMSIGFLVPPDQPLIWRGPMLHSVIRQFLADVEWGDLDYLVIDLPPGTGDAQLSLSQLLPLTGGLIVTLPQKVALEDARRGLEMFRILEVPVIGVVENMSYLAGPSGVTLDLFGRGGGKQLAEKSCVPFLGEIPIDPEVRIGCDAGLPMVVAHPDSEAARALNAIAGKVAARLSVLASEKVEQTSSK